MGTSLIPALQEKTKGSLFLKDLDHSSPLHFKTLAVPETTEEPLCVFVYLGALHVPSLTHLLQMAPI